MDEKLKNFFEDWDHDLKDREKLNRGEWTSKGEKKLTFDISEFTIKHQVRGDKFRGGKEPLAHLTYEFSCTGMYSGDIIIGKMPSGNWPDVQLSDGKCSIGDVNFYKDDKTLEKFSVVIALSKTAFEDLSQLILSFEESVRLTVNIQRELTDEGVEKISVTGYEISKHHSIVNKKSN
jgi:hypothetical protein